MARRGARSGRIIEVYLDESLKRRRYDLYGGLWISRERATHLRRKLSDLRVRHAHMHELKWVKASGRELRPVFCDLAEILTGQLWATGVRFNTFIVDRSQLNMAFHDGDRERFYYQCFYQLLRNRARVGESYIVTMDRRTAKRDDRLSELQRIVNRGARRDLGLGYDAVIDVQLRPSSEDDLLQAVDVILGAIGFHVSGRHREPAASYAKCDLAERLRRGMRVQSLAFASRSPEDGPVNNWWWQPTGRPKHESPPSPTTLPREK